MGKLSAHTDTKILPYPQYMGPNPPKYLPVGNDWITYNVYFTSYKVTIWSNRNKMNKCLISYSEWKKKAVDKVLKPETHANKKRWEGIITGLQEGRGGGMGDSQFFLPFSVFLRFSLMWINYRKKLTGFHSLHLYFSSCLYWGKLPVSF